MASKLKWPLLILLVLLTNIYISMGTEITMDILSCSGLQSVIQRERMNFVISSKGLTSLPRYCPVNCCDAKDEAYLHEISHSEYLRALRETLSMHVQQQLLHNIQRFDVAFVAALRASNLSLVRMFTRTYGMMYEQNAPLFDQLYRKLEHLYKNQPNSIGEMDQLLNSFFEQLFVRIFRLLSGRTSSAQYELCLHRHMKALAPFGALPDVISSELKRTFMAARSFANGLAQAKYVVANILSDTNTSKTCINGLTQLHGCPLCAGIAYLRPCFTHCAQILNECLSDHESMNEDWNIFLDTMQRMSRSLAGPMNVEAALGPLAIKISEAVMNVQENAATLMSSVFDKCGPDNRVRRSADGVSIGNLRSVSSEETDSQDEQDENRVSMWKKQMNSIRSRLKRLKNYWSKLPRTLCSEDRLLIRRSPEIMNSMSIKRCWNGTAPIDMQSERDIIQRTKTVTKVTYSMHMKKLILQATSGQMQNLLKRKFVEQSPTSDRMTIAEASARRFLNRSLDQLFQPTMGQDERVLIGRAMQKRHLDVDQSPTMKIFFLLIIISILIFIIFFSYFKQK